MNKSVVVAAIPLLALATACSGSSSKATGTTGAQGSVNPSIEPPTDAASSPADVSTAPSSAAPATSAAPASSAAPAIPRCHTSQLKATIGDGQGAAGTIFTTVLLLNTSQQTCHVFGYPGLGLRDAGGRDLPSKVTRGGGMLSTGAPTSITLAPAVSASFSFTYSDNPTGSDTQAACPKASTLVVTPPDERDPLTTAFTGAPCEGDLHVSPVVAGTSGAQG